MANTQIQHNLLHNGVNAHGIVWKTVANAAARTALSISADDVAGRKVILQSDDNTLWVPLTVTPTFQQLGSGGGAGVLTLNAVAVSLVDPSVNNLNPAGFTDEFAGDGVAGVPVRITATQAVTITGLVPPPQPSGKWAVPTYWRNVGSFNVTLAHESASSTAANRFTLPGSANLTLLPGDTVIMIYDFGATPRWTVY